MEEEALLLLLLMLGGLLGGGGGALTFDCCAREFEPWGDDGDVIEFSVCSDEGALRGPF